MRNKAETNASAPDAAPMLVVDDLRVRLHAHDRIVRAVNGVSFTLERGRTLGIVGESGSGKTVTVRTLMGLISRERAEISGSIRFEGREIAGRSPRRMREVWGTGMAMVFQDPLSSLNPVMRIGHQVVEAVRSHQSISRADAHERARELLEAVHIPDVPARMRQYPHELSGGMRQRVVIAIALAGSPKVLIADEPTTALDVTIQAEILDLIAELQRNHHMALILISHDFGVVASEADEVAVMYAGRIVERGPTIELFENPKMPYTEALLSAMPRMDQPTHQRLRTIEGRPPDLIREVAGCSFAPRCARAQEQCRVEQPELTPLNPLHSFACFYPIGGAPSNAVSQNGVHSTDVADPELPDIARAGAVQDGADR